MNIFSNVDEIYVRRPQRCIPLSFLWESLNNQKPSPNNFNAEVFL